MKRILIMATRPFLDDGLTKVEMEIYYYNRHIINFEFSTGYYQKNKYTECIERDNVKINQLPSKKFFPVYMAAIFNLIKREKYDAVYIHGNSAMMLLEALPAKLAGCHKIVTHCHNTRARFPFIHYLFKPVLNKIVDEKIACSSYSAEWVYGKAKAEVIVNGIDIEKYQFNQGKRERIRNEMNLDGCFVIGHVGRFSAEKNHAFLLEIFRQIYSHNKKSRLLLVGEGELEPEVRKKAEIIGISDVVYFMGARKDVRDYLSAMDVMILPSLYEGLCIVAIEAQANGLPLVTADTLSPESYVADNVYSESLQNDITKWENIVLLAEHNGRQNNTELLMEKGYSADRMMKKIQTIL